MGLKCFNYAFNLSESEHWPDLEPRQTISANCKSESADPNRDSKLGLGFVEAMSVLLTEEANIGREGDEFSVTYQSNSSGETRTAASQNYENATSDPYRALHGMNSMKGGAMLTVLEAMLLEESDPAYTGELREVRERWESLLMEVEIEVGKEAPYTKDQVIALSSETLCQNAMMALTDSIYFALKNHHDRGARDVFEAPGPEFASLSGEDRRRLYDLPQPQSAQALPSGYLTTTLTGLLETGGTALLVGPTGTFKTTTATRSANEAGAQLEVVKGRPGIEDRDFFGAVVPTEQGPAWRDGPVTSAFRKGQDGPTMLLMDELLRFEPLFLGAFVGLLDPASPAELAARSIEPTPGFEDAPHYVAKLPTGEAVACPTEQLTLVATTNMGSDYVQSGQLDAALMGRFQLTIEVEKPDPNVKRHLYKQAAGTKGADFLEAVEEIVEDGHIDTGGLYIRKAHPRLMLNMAAQMDRIRSNSQTASSEDIIAREAAEMTVVPNVIEREPSGLLKGSDREALLTDVEEAARQMLY